MKRVIRNVLFAVHVLSLSAFIVYRIEAEKEIEVLCSLFEPDRSLGYVTQTLNTGNLLKYRLDGQILMAESIYNLSSVKCEVEFTQNELVLNSSFHRYFNLTEMLTRTGIILSFLLMIFQLLLALGYPLGKYAWGGIHEVLPRNLRVGSFISALLYTLIAVLVIMNLNNSDWLSASYPIIGVLFLLSSFANLNSETKCEKRIMTPATVALYLCFLSLSLQ